MSFSYMILAPALMTAEKDQKKAAQKCFDSVGLDPDSYRIGHTKARILFDFIFSSDFCIRVRCPMSDHTRKIPLTEIHS